MVSKLHVIYFFKKIKINKCIHTDNVIKNWIYDWIHCQSFNTTPIRKMIQFLVFVVQPQLNSTTSPIYINVIKN